MEYFLYLFGFLPSIIWLIFYLRKDKRPEPNKIVILCFFGGIASAFLVILPELFWQEVVIAPLRENKKLLFLFLNLFIGAGLFEEYGKYLGAKFTAFKKSELDEPIDVILYMIISALGFAALENIFVLKTSIEPFVEMLSPPEALKTAIINAIFRFPTSTFLHAIASGIFGYFLVLWFLKNKKRFFYYGLSLAFVLHGTYNYIIEILAKDSLSLRGFLKICFFLTTGAVILGFLIKKAKKLKSICQI